MQKSTVGILAGGGAAAAGAVAAKLVGQNLYASSVASNPAAPSAIGQTLAAQPWIGALALGAVAAGILHFGLKKKEEAVAAAFSAAVVALPVAINSYVQSGTIAGLDPATQAALAKAGLGVAVAERGMNGAPTVELFQAPPALRLSGASNTGSSMSDGYAPVFGGQSF